MPPGSPRPTVGVKLFLMSSGSHRRRPVKGKTPVVFRVVIPLIRGLDSSLIVVGMSVKSQSPTRLTFPNKLPFLPVNIASRG